MTPMLMGILALLPLACLLCLIVVQDIRHHRIPNQLVLIGIVLGVTLNGLLPEGQGFNSIIPGGLGWLGALKGMLLGLLLLLPMYLLAVIGAGDVKLMAMVGAFLGHGDVIGALLGTLIAGGIMAIAVALWSRQLLQLFRNIQHLLLGFIVNMHLGHRPTFTKNAFRQNAYRTHTSVGDLPYAVAIASGTLLYLLWQRQGGALVTI